MVRNESPLLAKLWEYETRNAIPQLAVRVGIDQRTLRAMLRNSRSKYKGVHLDILYEFFGLPKDSFYVENKKKWIKPTESVLGEILRERRIRKGWDIHQVARMIRMDDRSIARIEAGDTLPNGFGYAMVNLLRVYEFTEEEQQKIRWHIAILHDIVEMRRRMLKDDIGTERCGGMIPETSN